MTSGDQQQGSRPEAAWVAARYEADSLPSELRLGDGSWPGDDEQFNRPLRQSQGYRVFLRGLTTGVVRFRHILSFRMSNLNL